MVCGSVVGVEGEGALELVLRGCPVVIEEVQQFGQGVVSLRKLIIESERLFQGFACPAWIIGKEINIGQPRVGRCIVGVLLNRQLKVSLRLFVAVSLVEEKTSF